MVLRESPFPNCFLAGLHGLSWGLIFPCYWLLDRILATCVSTTLERQQRIEQECYLFPLKIIFGGALYLILFVISLPFALLGFILWVPLQAARRPFAYSYNPKVEEKVQNKWACKESGILFSFISANLCLLPDGLARFSNLSHSQKRSHVIGRYIVDGVCRPRIKICIDSPSTVTLSPESKGSLLPSRQPSYGAIESHLSDEALLRETNLRYIDSSEESSELERKIDGTSPNGSLNYEPAADPSVVTLTVSGQVAQSPMEGSSPTGHPKPQHTGLRTLSKKNNIKKDTYCEISSLFPADADFVCLQEVFDKRAAARLKSLLSPIFGHILYDIGTYALHGCSDFKFFNSGLFLASRYPILDAKYRFYPNGRGEDALAAKGLLCVKIQVGSTRQDKQTDIVGYLNCTHLHAPEGDGQIRFEQMTTMMDWIKEFQQSTLKSGEKVVFDVLCGDFNFDNCSPDDHLEQSHTVFNCYKDPCRVGPMQEHPWAVGTLLQAATLYDENVRTPEGLQRILNNEERRKLYIAPPINPDGSKYDCEQPEAPWAGRRIDYILYCENTVSKHYKTELEEFCFITHLAGLSDHIPVGLRLFVSTAEDEMETL